jgi:hypothetical protein
VVFMRLRRRRVRGADPTVFRLMVLTDFAAILSP